MNDRTQLSMLISLLSSPSTDSLCGLAATQRTVVKDYVDKFTSNNAAVEY